jgi:mannitol operon repressor
MSEFEQEHLRPFLDYLSVSNKESDRGKVLVTLAQLDEMLGAILKSFCVDGAATDELMNGANAPFNSVYNKTNAALALGLITDAEYRDATLMRRIRNEFAHSINASFSDQSIQSKAMLLEFGLGYLIERSDPILQDPRTRFLLSSTALISALCNRTHYVADDKRKLRDWPP